MNAPPTMNIGEDAGGRVLDSFDAFKSKLEMKQSEIESEISSAFLPPWIEKRCANQAELDLAVECVVMISMSNWINPARSMEATALLREFMAAIAYCRMLLRVNVGLEGIKFTCCYNTVISFVTPGYKFRAPRRLDGLGLGLQFYVALLKDKVSSMYKDMGAPYPLPLPSPCTLDNILQFLTEHRFSNIRVGRPPFPYADLFSGIRCFIHPTPIRDSIVTMVCAFGGSVSVDVGDLTITHEIADHLARGPGAGAGAVEGRRYCNSIWLFDSYESGVILDTPEYPMGPGRWY